MRETRKSTIIFSRIDSLLAKPNVFRSSSLQVAKPAPPAANTTRTDQHLCTFVDLSIDHSVDESNGGPTILRLPGWAPPPSAKVVGFGEIRERPLLYRMTGSNGSTAALRVRFTPRGIRRSSANCGLSIMRYIAVIGWYLRAMCPNTERD